MGTKLLQNATFLTKWNPELPMRHLGEAIVVQALWSEIATDENRNELMNTDSVLMPTQRQMCEMISWTWAAWSMNACSKARIESRRALWRWANRMSSQHGTVVECSVINLQWFGVILCFAVWWIDMLATRGL